MKAQTDAIQSVDEPGYRLWCAEPAFANESRGSWIQRLCGSHSYSIGFLSKVTGIQPTAGDWDRPLAGGAWGQLLAATGQPRETCDQAIRGLSALSNMFRAKPLLLYEGGKPSSRWCPKCLSDDEVPYLRWTWRLNEVKSCALHRVPLMEFCPWCKSALNIQRALLTFAGHGAVVSDLAACASCGMSLFDSIAETENDDLGAPGADQNLIDLIRIIEGAADISQKQLELDLVRCRKLFLASKSLEEQELFPGLAGDGWVELFVKRLPNRLDAPLLINGDTFREESIAKRNDVASRSWSTLLRPQERVRLAKALSIVREERNRIRIGHKSFADRSR